MTATEPTTTPAPGRHAARTTSTRLRVVYRSHGGENRKARPEWYSKRLALASFVRAVDAVATATDVVFLNDGPVDAGLVTVMRTAGEVRPVDGGSNRRSFRAAVAHAAGRWTAPGDLVWFAEDDYLYAPDALARLLAAADRLDGEYFALYGRYALDTASPRGRTASLAVPGAGPDGATVEIDGTRWYRGLSTTSTFGVRGPALAQDARLLRTMPFTGGAWDHATCLALQGRTPYPWSALVPEADAPEADVPRSRAAALAAVRAAANLRSLRRPGRRRRLWTPAPEPVTHLEDDGLAAGTDWPALAQDVTAWADANLP